MLCIQIVTQSNSNLYFSLANASILARKYIHFAHIDESLRLRQEQSHSNSIVGVRFFYFCIKGVAGFVVKNKIL